MFATLDPAVWSYGWPPGSGLQQPMGGAAEFECYDPTHVLTGAEGLQLELTNEAQTVDGIPYPYTSAMITSKSKWYWQRGGYVQFDVEFPLLDGEVANWPGVWACTDEDGDPTAPGILEFDLAEGLGGVLAFHAHYHGLQDGDTIGIPTPGVHTIGAWWDAQASAITVYYDDIARAPVPVPSDSKPMFLLISHAIDNTYGGPKLAPAVLRVASVRGWTPA